MRAQNMFGETVQTGKCFTMLDQMFDVVQVLPKGSTIKYGYKRECLVTKHFQFRTLFAQGLREKQSSTPNQHSVRWRDEKTMMIKPSHLHSVFKPNNKRYVLKNGHTPGCCG